MDGAQANGPAGTVSLARVPTLTTTWIADSVTAGPPFAVQRLRTVVAQVAPLLAQALRTHRFIGGQDNLAALEARFEQGFPGRVGRFSDGQREIVLRWVTRVTCQLHASSDCFKASGYRINPLPLQGWSRFRATRGAQVLEVRERISDRTDGQWCDVSAWYWSALLGRGQGPWWAVTVAQRPAGGPP